MTKSEKILNQLAWRVFLPPWCFPNPQRLCTGKGGQVWASELCDLLVVFGSVGFLIQDKEIGFPKHSDANIAWSRWHRGAVFETAKQLVAAYRIVKDFPQRVFADAKMTRSLSKMLLQVTEWHLLVTCRGAASACRRHFNGGTGSFMVENIPIEKSSSEPFLTGTMFKDSFVHVIPDASLDILLQHLDTATDFVGYLKEKERLFSSGTTVRSMGEEETMSHYLSVINDRGEHGFTFIPSVRSLMISEGHFENYVTSVSRVEQVKANRVSYSWDRLIRHLFEHFDRMATPPTSSNDEAAPIDVYYWLARESRTRRRLLGGSLVDFFNRVRGHDRYARVIGPSKPGDPFWVLLMLDRPVDMDPVKYQEARASLLYGYLLVVRHLHPEARDVLGIAMCAPGSSPQSEDLAWLRGADWNEDRAKEAKYWHEEEGLLREGIRREYSVREYPLPKHAPSKSTRKLGRNDPCPCGSHRKFKRCCLASGRFSSPIHGMWHSAVSTMFTR